MKIIRAFKIGSKLLKGTVGSILFIAGGGKIGEDNNNLFWDNTNKRLGIETKTPTEKLEIKGNLFLDTDNDQLLLGEGKNMSIYYNGIDGHIKTDEVASSDLHITTGAEKTLELDTEVWDDQQVNIGDIAGRGWFGNAWSDIVEYRAGIALELQNSTLNSYKFKFNAQLNHKYAEGEDIQFHIHTGSDGTASGDVVLEFNYQWTSVHSTFPTTTTITKTFTVNGTNGYHGVMGFEADMDGTDKKISSIVLAQVERLAGDSADTFSGTLYVLGVDYHVPLSTIGSRQEWVK